MSTKIKAGKKKLEDCPSGAVGFVFTCRKEKYTNGYNQSSNRAKINFTAPLEGQYV